MRVSKGIVLLSVAATLICASSAVAQSSDGRRRVRVGGSPEIGPIAAAVDSGGRTLAGAQPADSVANGIGIGALIGAGTGLALMAWAYGQCDGSCDAPEPLPMYLQAAAMGAGVGSVIGWIADAARKSTGRRVDVDAFALPKRAAVRVRVRW